METNEMISPEFIMCEKHPHKKAKKYCSFQDCKKFICNSCCLEEHSKHLDSLQGIQILFKKELDSIEIFSAINDAEINKIKNSVFKCLVNVFHEAKNYCFDCKNFICIKCSAIHVKSHSIASNGNLIEVLNEKLKIIKNLFNKEKFILKIIEEETNLIKLSKEINFVTEEKLLKNAFELKFKFESFVNLLKKLKLIIIGKINKFFSDKSSCLFNKKVNLNKFTSFLDSYKFEKDKNKFFANFVKNESLINSIIKDNEVKEINQLVNFNNKLKELYDDTITNYSNAMKNFTSEADLLFAKYNEELGTNKDSFIKGFEEIINKENFDLNEKEEFLNALHSEGNRIDFIYDENIHLEQVFTGTHSEITNTAFQPENKINEINESNKTQKEIVKYITKEIYKETDKDLFEKEFKQKFIKEYQNNLSLNNSVNLNFIVEERIKENLKLDNENNSIINQPEIQKIEVEIIKYQKPTSFIDIDLTASIESEFTICKQEKKKNFSDNKLRQVKFEEPTSDCINLCNDGQIIERELNNFNKENSSTKGVLAGVSDNLNDEDFDKIGNFKTKIIENNNNNNNNNNNKRKYTPSSKSSGKSQQEENLIDNDEPNNLAKDLSTNKNEFYSNLKILENQLIHLTENNLESKTNNDSKSNNDINTNNALDSSNSLSAQININTNNLNIEQNEKHELENLIQITETAEPEIIQLESDLKRISNASAKSKKSNNSSLSKSAFNDILSFGFNCRSCFAFNPSENKITEIENTYFKFPAFHSFINIPPFAFIGGGKDSQGKELNSFSKFSRVENKKIELVELQKMNNAKHHHLYVYYKQKHQILSIGGSKVKACEAYDISSDSWASFGELNVSRECPSACVTDQNTLFVFFGFDKNVNKYVSTIEKLDLSVIDIKNDNLGNNNKKFEIINVKGNQNILKKHSSAALQIDSGKVLIFGGINSLRNSCKDILVYDLKANTGQFYNHALPANASFHNCGFVDLDIQNCENTYEMNNIESDEKHKKNKGNVLYNFTDDFKIIKLNLDNFAVEMIE